MAYFKYQFLNALRDELALTRGYRKLTLFILLYLVLPAGGLGGGLAWGAKSHSLVRIVSGGAGGILAGATQGAWLEAERFPDFRMSVWQCQWGGVFLANSERLAD